MISAIHIYWGDDQYFEDAVKELEDVFHLKQILDDLGKVELKFEGTQRQNIEPTEIENLVIYTDDYGGVKEWALLGFTKNILNNEKYAIENVWLSNPPSQLYQDVCRNFDKDVIEEHKTNYPVLSLEQMRLMAQNYQHEVIGQPTVMKNVLSAMYSLRNASRNKPVTLLFLGDSGIGKTETAKFISTYLGSEMVRVQFSMQQTTASYQYIFGSEHGEDCLARELLRRKSNVILFDEFDKVSPVFYNAFYQMFDEGIFVDENYHVDVSKCIIICTSNYKTEEEAAKSLGMPIYSRFSKVIHFNPISIEDKIKIAQKCYGALIVELGEKDRELLPDDKILPKFEDAIQRGLYPNMRMLKHDLEDAINYELLIAHHIL